jgi:methylmalonyl-CoA mutase cobalamin-binding subunit
MKLSLDPSVRLGLLRPAADAHSLGISSIERLLEDCGIRASPAGVIRD